MKKPEWFELAEKDGGKPRTPVKTSARGVLLALPLLLIGVGVVVAQTSQDAPATTEELSVAQSKPSIATPPLPPKYADDDDHEGDDEDDHKRGSNHDDEEDDD